MAQPEPRIAAVKNAEPKGEAAPSPALYHLILFQGARDEFGRGEINRNLVQDIQAMLDDQITTPREQTEIDVWLESPGGDANAAYKLVLDLRERCKLLRVVIPDYAKSAATLVALGADEIFMTPAAELGPLDVQIDHPDPDREGTTISALDVADSLEFLGTTAVDLVLTGGGTIRQYTGLRRSEVLREMLKFTAEFLRPVTEKLDPHLLHQAANQLRIAERYAINMMHKRNLPAISEKEADDLMARLIRAYPSHGFVISRDEARDLGLPVEAMKSYPRHREVKKLYRNFERTNKTFIEVVGDTAFDQPKGQATQEEKPDEASNTKADAQ